MLRLSPLAAGAALALAATLAGCTDPCLEIANRICGCQPDQPSQDACKSNAKERFNRGSKPSTADQAECTRLLDTCPDPSDEPDICTRIDFPDGKVDCGYAYPVGGR
jgi:hypothetical protein